MGYCLAALVACSIRATPNPTLKLKNRSLTSLAPYHLIRLATVRSIRSSLSRADVKRHTYTGKRSIQRSMISGPQGDVKHTGHVGLDGAYFGDISFLDPAGCPPRQVVTPYKPSEDLEQVPLINPNSPSHLTAACTTPYPLLSAERAGSCDEVDLSYTGTMTKNLKKQSLKNITEPTTSKSILNKVKSATLGRSHKTDDGGSASKTDDPHEYHEISDTDTETTMADRSRTDNLVPLESPGIPKSYGDFSQSLLDEMESMFRSLDSRGRLEETGSSATRHFDFDTALRSHTFKSDKKKGHHTGTMKPMSAHDERTLDTAVAMANEITTRSMNDLGLDSKVPRSPSDRSIFHFKFPLVSRHHTMPHETEKDINGKQERRNFSEEAHSVPDCQATLSEESKQAYTSLIEQPTPASLLPHLAPDAPPRPSTVPKPARASKPDFHSLQKHSAHKNRQTSNVFNYRNGHVDDNNQNELPLPPRATKPKLIDKPRHFRKYPLRLPTNNDYETKTPSIDTATQKSLNIYQNAVPSSIIKEYMDKRSDSSMGNNGRDVFDGCEKPKVDTNPFTSSAGPSSANPFNSYLPMADDPASDGDEDHPLEQYFEEGSLVKDHVSVEDLLEFADQKPCGRQRGVESDEVRIMNKVLKQQVSPEECLEALELSEWNVHRAIKLVRVKIAVDGAVSLKDCCEELARANGDIVRASAVLVLSKKQ